MNAEFVGSLFVLIGSRPLQPSGQTQFWFPQRVFPDFLHAP